MEAKSYLAAYSQNADQFLDEFFAHKTREARQLGDSGNGLINVPEQMMVMYREYMRGGKKLRGALVQLGYECGGGANLKEILPISVALEIIHSFILMHDDVMDQDELRRGMYTLHKQWETISKQKLVSRANHKHLGESLAYTTGDVGGFLAMGLIANSQLSPEKKLTAFSHLSKFLLKTGYGQGLDVVYEVSEHVGERDVLRVHLHKSAHYTISGPLILGGLLSGATQQQLAAMEQFGEKVGIAFQLRDDELGLLGNEQILGKPIGSDIREGKNTLLRIKAMELANQRQRKRLEEIYGRQQVTDQEINLVKEITVQSGALDYSQKLTRKLTTEGKQTIPLITADIQLQDTLGQIADFIVERKK